MFRNPIVHFWFMFGFAFTVLLSSTVEILGVYVFIYLGLLIVNRRYLHGVIHRLKPGLFIFPIMIILYIGFSTLFTTNTLDQIMEYAGFSLLRLILMVAIMALYFEQPVSQAVLTALRSLWVKLDCSWRRVEDSFLFLELIFRFYPTFQREWNTIRHSRKALGLDYDNNKWKMVQETAKNLPGLLLRSFRKAEDIAAMMQMRGYGKQIPRGVAYPISFYARDGVIIIGLTLLFIGLNSYAAV